MRHVTLRILCEGQTELNFATKVLRPHLQSKLTYVKAESLTPRGFGVVPWDTLRRAIKDDVGRSRAHEYVTTMIDLYKIGRYPEAARQEQESVHDRVRRIESNMAFDLPNPRFIPYVQLHEFEALVLVDCSYLPEHFPDGEADRAPAILRKSIGETEPELIDDGEQTAPSKRIISAVKAYDNLKSTVGPDIARAIGLPRLRAACPHFGEWLAKLEGLSADADDLASG
jgi:hypothetical protein